MSIILGIDPGSRVTGYGFIKVAGNRFQYLDAGCIKTGSGEQAERLKIIFARLSELIEQHVPDQAAIEEVFIGRNAASALKLGQARGSAMVACTCHDLPLAEYSPRQVKQALVGAGSAQKQQVQHMVKAILGTDATLEEDAADALAVAICHANTQAGLARMAGARTFSRKRFKA